MSSSMIKIDVLEEARWGECRELRLESLKEEPIAFGSSVEEEDGLSDAEWRFRVKNALFAFDNDQPIGMIVFIRQTNAKSSHIGNIFGLYVKKVHRGRGIGHHMIHAVLEKFESDKHIRKVKLAVNIELASAISLYEKFGFYRVGILKQELQYNDHFYDELVMEKILKE